MRRPVVRLVLGLAGLAAGPMLGARLDAQQLQLAGPATVTLVLPTDGARFAAAQTDTLLTFTVSRVAGNQNTTRQTTLLVYANAPCTGALQPEWRLESTSSTPAGVAQSSGWAPLPVGAPGVAVNATPVPVRGRAQAGTFQTWVANVRLRYVLSWTGAPAGTSASCAVRFALQAQ